MQVFRSLAEISPHAGASVVTIGNFDGVHCGHRMVIDAVIARAHALNAQAIAVTFDPHPVRILKPDVDVRLITPLAHKLELLAELGLDATLVLPFTPEFATWTPGDFARRVLRDALHAIEVHEGENFRFGFGASADIMSLAELGAKLGFGVRAYQPFLLRGAPVSSSRIRGLIATGALSQARALLGRSFAVRSAPAPGRGYGTRYTVPTINLAPYSDLLPAHGVYVTTLRVGDGPGSRFFQSVTNAGNRPTFGADSYAVESHLLDFEPISLTEDSALELTFLQRLRSEIRFSSPDALREQIGLDVAKARRYFALTNALHIPTVAK